MAIKAMGLAKRVPQAAVERASRLFQLALEGGTYKADGSQPKNYVLGRKSEYTQASCLYVACRMEKTHHMLIDFADAISVSRMEVMLAKRTVLTREVIFH
jgi:transcription factor IIIB subunit 2